MRIYPQKDLIIIEAHNADERDELCEVFQKRKPIFKKALFRNFGLAKLQLRKDTNA